MFASFRLFYNIEHVFFFYHFGTGKSNSNLLAGSTLSKFKLQFNLWKQNWGEGTS